MNAFDVELLQTYNAYPSISLLIRTHRTLPAREQDPIRVKNAVTQAKERLDKEFGYREVADIHKRLDGIANKVDYAKMLDGLAVFVNKDVEYIAYLPVELDTRVVIDASFATRDIVRAMQRMHRYWVLSLGEKPTRLYRGYGRDLTEIIEPVHDQYGNEKDGFPYSYLPPDVESKSEYMGEKGRSRFDPSSVHTPQQDMYMQRGGGAEYLDARRDEFLRRIDELAQRFIGVDKTPVVLVGVHDVCMQFQSLCSFADRIIGIRDGNYTDCAPHHVAERVWPIVEEHVADEREKTLHTFQEDAIGSLHHAIGLDAVWRMATEGRVQTLLVEEGYRVPGVVNPDTPTDLVIYDQEQADAAGISDDLVDIVIETVLGKGGSIVFYPKDELGEYDRIAAILRY